MALSRKIQPDRPIWPAAPEAGGSSTVGASGRERSGRAVSSPPGGGSQRMTSTLAQTEGFGSFSN